MEAACASLALVHRAWISLVAVTGPCPGIQRRLERIGEWSALARDAGAAGFADIDKRVRPWAERAQILLSRLAQQVPSALLPLLQRSLPLQPCLCDVWHDHVLFTVNKVTGLIDYGGVKIDHVAVDLARLLGSMAEDNMVLVAAGLQAYMRVRPLSLEEQRLVGLLDRTGTIVGLANWLKWLCYERRVFEDYALVAQRMRRLIERMERWPANFLF
jgi:Ser/Thr protein kinase RdoA (MazF antagonist)